MDLPARFGDYELLERIAAGGMAEVFLARRRGTDGFEKRLVVKRILPGLARNPRFVQMFVQEAKLSVSLCHPNIVQVFELGRVAEDPYLAMEYIHGRDLTHALRALRRLDERMPVGLAATIAARVARGLAFAHARAGPDGRPLHIVHRDVSPHNIVVSFEGEVKLVDFGIARLVGEAPEAAADGRPGGGKFAYMSPEQARGEPATARSDLFALGVVLFEMLAGRRLFADADPDAKLQQVLECRVPDVRAINPAVPDALHAILSRLLAARPEDRPAGGAAVEDELRAFVFASGERWDSPQIGAWLRALFPEEATSAAAANLELLAEDLHAMHSRADPEPEVVPSEPSMPSVSESARTRTDERGPRLLAQSRGELRQVVVLVAEVNGLTELSARAEVDDLARVHYRMLRMVRALIDRLGGVAQRFDDDTLTVFFGLPRALGDDLDRALACARELHRLASRLRRRGLGVEFAIGVHVGDISVSRRVGRQYRFAARGDTLKAAVRLAYAADPGATLVSDRVASLAGDRYPFDRGPELRRKGVRHTRPSYLLAGPRRHAGRGAAGRWFRRGDEAEVLRAAIGALREGRGARIGVCGEAGIGKTRFFRELRELASRRGLPVFHGRALPYGGDRAFSLFRDLVSDVLGIRPDTGPGPLRARLARLAELKLEPADIEVIASLFALELRERKEPTRDAMLAAGGRLVRGLAADGPVVLLLEDVQYLDALETRLIAQLLAASASEPVLVLTSWRGEAPPELAKLLDTLQLGPLQPEQMSALAADLLGAEAVGPDLTRLVQRTAEGNPLYLEEIIKALQRAGRIYFEGSTARLKDPRVDPGLPDTLHGLIAARVDALDAPSRGALQVAAVIGMSFSPALLAAAVGADDPVVLVGELVRAGLIVPEDRTPDTSYAFASVLIWETVLRSILGIQRREYHRMVAAGMERLYGDHLDPLWETWAGHAHAGGRLRDAARALRDAGDRHREAGFLDRALECYQRGLGWLADAPRDQRDPALEAWLQYGAGETCLLLGRPRAQRHLQVALDIASEEGPAEVEARTMLALGQLYLTQGKLVLARAHLDTALSMARRLDHRPGLIGALDALGAHKLESGQAEEARAIYAEGLRRAEGAPLLEAQMKVGLATVALHRDEPEVAHDLLASALPAVEAAGDRILAGRIVNNLGLVHLARGDWAQAVQSFKRALELREGLGYRRGQVINLHNLGDAWLRAGNLPQAGAAFEQSREVARECGNERGVVLNDVYLAWLRGLGGEDGEAALEEAGQRARQLGDLETALTARWFTARLAARRDPVGARRLLERVGEEAEQGGFVALAREIRRS